MPLQAKLGVIGVPLRGIHPDAPLDPQESLDQLRAGGGYDLDIDYQKDPPAPV